MDSLVGMYPLALAAAMTLTYWGSPINHQSSTINSLFRPRQRPRPLEHPHPSRPVDLPEALTGLNTPVPIGYIANDDWRDVTPIASQSFSILVMPPVQSSNVSTPVASAEITFRFSALRFS